jgi:hypothetical protein
MTEAVGDVAPGHVLGRFVLERCLGRGGMGEVWQALDRELERTVAVKLLRPGRSGDEAWRAQLRREAKVMARLSHPNIAVIYEVGIAEGRAFVAMELARESLRDYLASGRPWREVIARYCGVARGLAAAHRAGVAHRDFKPDNVLIGAAGETKVADFGFAASDDPERVAGTPAYMAPEQILGRPSDARADQFAFCVAVWEALYGDRPYASKAVEGVPRHLLQLAAITAGKLARPRTRRGPRAIEGVLRRGLDPDPDRRFVSMDEIADALERAARPHARRIVRWFAVATLAIVAGVIAIATTRAPSATRATEMQTIVRAAPHLHRPLVAVARDGQIALVDREVDPPVAYVTSTRDLRRSRIEIPAGLAPSAIAIDERTGAILIGGRRSGTWELWAIGSGATRIGELPALATPGPGEFERVVGVGGEGLVLAGDAVVRVAPQGTTTILPPGPGIARHALAIDPAGNRLAVLEEVDGTRRVRVIDLATSRTLEIAAARGLLAAVAWLDDHTLVLADQIGSGTELVARRGSVTERIARVDGIVLDARTTDLGLAVELATSTYGVAILTRATGERRKLSAGGWQAASLAGWIDDRTVLITAALTSRFPVVALGLDGSQQVIAHDGGMAIPYRDGSRLVVQDRVERGCGLRAIAHDRLVATLPLSCDGAPEISCASLAGTCVVARWEDGVHVYRRLDPIALELGEIIYRDEVQRAEFAEPALSPDGRYVAIPAQRDGMRILELATGTTTTVSSSGRRWISARWSRPDAVVVTELGDLAPSKLVEVTLEAGGGSSLATLIASDQEIFAHAAASPDGAMLAFSTLDVRTRWVLVTR